MMKLLNARSIALLLILLLLTSFMLQTSKAAIEICQIRGAIWTTDSSGKQVNGNLYNNPRSVYLVGGPPKKGSLGLDDGWYYFQVTDPGGKTLLSSDSIDHRSFKVKNGYIVEVPKNGHNWNNDSNGPGLVVQLAPFEYSSKVGGEYKVWVTSALHYSPGQGVFGFISSLSKTDNFKVGRLNEVSKYFELSVTSGISEIGNIAFYVSYTIQINGAPGLWRTGQLRWNRTESSLEVFRYSTTFAIGTYIYWQFIVANTIGWMSDLHGPELISQAGMVNKEICPLFLISGHKYDNRPNDIYRMPIANSLIKLTSGMATVTTWTDLSGYYQFVAVSPGSYKVSTEGWSFGTDTWYEFTATSPVDQTFDFYNYTVTQMANLSNEVVPYFNVVFTPSNDGTNTYKLSSTNPGSFHFNVEKYGSPGSPVLIDVLLPLDKENGVYYDSPNFILHHTYIGGGPADDVHVYKRINAYTLEEVTSSYSIVSTIDGKRVTISGNMPNDSESILVTVHIDYQISSSLSLDQVNSFKDFKYLFTVYIYGSMFGVTSIFRIAG